MNEQTAPTTKTTSQSGLMPGPGGTKVRLTRTQAAKAAAAAMHSGLKVLPLDGEPEVLEVPEVDEAAAGQEGETEEKRDAVER